MGAFIDQDGKLEISAGSPLERFALAQWFELWKQHKVVISIEVSGMRQEVTADDHEWIKSGDKNAP